MSHEDMDKEANTENFIEYFEIKKNTDFHNVVLCMYYSFTTLSTVGLGDLHPRSNEERLLTAMILLLGVSIFSIFLGDFSALVERYKNLQADIDYTDELDNFFLMLQHYNKETEINEELNLKIRHHFLYKSVNDKN
jgi:hypothetical protein